MTEEDTSGVIEEMERLIYDENQLLQLGYRWHPCPRSETVGLCWCKYWPSLTRYPYEGNDPIEDPNRPNLMCDECGKEYTEMMESRWADYYAGCL